MHKVMVRDTGFHLPETLIKNEAPTIHELYAALIADDNRNKMIVEDVVKSVKAKHLL